MLLLLSLVALCAGCGDDSARAGPGGTSTSTTTGGGDTGEIETGVGTTGEPSVGSSGSGPGLDTTTDGGASSSDGGSSGSGGEVACEPATLGQHVWVPGGGLQRFLYRVSAETKTRYADYLTSPVNPTVHPVYAASVNLNGDAAAATSNGTQAPPLALASITAFAGALENCPDPAATSRGEGDVRPYPDGCLLWRTDLPLELVEMVAWTQGEWSEETCRYENTRVWTTGRSPGSTGDFVLLLDGDSGAVLEEIELTGGPLFQGAVDADGNLWASRGAAPIVRVRLDDLSVTTFQQSGWIAIGPENAVWTCGTSVSRRDPETEAWQAFPGVSSLRGCKVDAAGNAWLTGQGVTVLEPGGEQVFELGAAGALTSLNFDAAGRVWAGDSTNAQLLVLDPEEGAFELVDEGYPYVICNGDLTGMQLHNLSAAVR
ncbi:MAG: hypothetical protein AAF721_13830 [Myxococcota bacterium]